MSCLQVTQTNLLPQPSLPFTKGDLHLMYLAKQIYDIKYRNEICVGLLYDDKKVNV